jgi:hypothetical protein
LIFDFSLWIVPLVIPALPVLVVWYREAVLARPILHSVVAKRRRGVPLGMHRINSEYLDPDSSDRSVTADILLRQEPDEDENEEEEDEDEGDDKEEDDDEENDERLFGVAALIYFCG